MRTEAYRNTEGQAGACQAEGGRALQAERDPWGWLDLGVPGRERSLGRSRSQLVEGRHVRCGLQNYHNLVKTRRHVRGYYKGAGERRNETEPAKWQQR